MNYSGWLLSAYPTGHTAQFAFEGIDAKGVPTFLVPDAYLLFSGEYQRAGKDLIISDDLRHFVVPDYFKGGGHGRPLLVSPDGAPLAPSVVDALTGYAVYAQAGPQSVAGKVVGHVAKMTGSASIVRNGVTIVANVGDAVYQSDVVQTGSNSTIGLVLDDGSTFNLSANARFLLNELSYDPNSTSNSLFLTLVQGAASFVAGQVAKTGDMKVATPTASIGIRGTAVNLDISSTDGKVSISVVDQQDGIVHAVQVFNNSGVLIGTVTSNGTSLTLTPTANFDVIAQQINKTPDQVAQEFSAFQQVLSTYDAAKQIFPNLPQHTDNSDHQNNNNNPSPNSTTKFAGSPPLNPPGTEYQPPAATTKTQTASAQVTPTTVVVTTTTSTDPSLTKQVAPPTTDPVIPVIPVVIPVNVVSLPFVVTSPNVVAITTGSGDHTGPVMSANGDVVYDPDGAIYFYDRAENATTTIASPANGWSYGSPTISSDGHYIFYQGANGGSSYVFVYGTDPSDPSHYHVQTLLGLGEAPAVSGDGGTIVASQASGNIAIYDLQGNLKGTIAPAAVGSSGALWLPAISADGHVIAFWNSDAQSAGGSGDLYALNLSTATIVHVAATVSGAGTAAPTVSADGHLVAYQSTDATGHSEIYLYDLQASSIVFHTANSSGSSFSPVLSPDGHFIVFTSDARLTSDDTNASPDVYVVDVTSPSDPIYKLVSEGGGVAAASGVAISAGGQYVAYGSSSNIFFADPTSGHSGVIVETAHSPSVLTADGLIALTGDSTGVQISVADQFGNATPNFSASFDGSGHILWNFSETKSDFAALAYGKDATQEFIVTLSADTGTLTIPIFVTVHNGVQPTISVEDFAPVASPVSLQDGQESVSYTITSGDLLSHVVDVDGPSLSIASLSIQSGDGSLSQIDSQTWTFSPTAGFSGHVVLNYQVTDSIKSANSTVSFNIALPLAITSINPDSGVTGDFITKDTMLTVSGTNGTLVGGERIQVSGDNGATWADVAQTTATTWSFVDPTAHNTSFTYQVRVLDSSNVSINSTAQAIIVDTTPPTLTISGGDGATNQTSLDVAGTVDLADAGSLVTVFDDGQSAGSAIAGSDGKWSVTVSLHNGANSLTAEAADVAGNVGTSNAVVVTLDTTAPTEAVAITAIATDSGTAGDFITNDTTLTVSGTNGALASGEKIQISSDNGTTWADVTQSTTTWSYVDPTTHPASFSYQVRIIDTAGNIGTTASQAVTIDTTAPTEAVAITAIATDSGTAGDFITNDTTLTVSGTNGALASGEKIQISSDNGTSWADVTQSTTTWSYVDPTMHPASFSYQVRIIDTAGNIGTTASQAVTIDTTAPTEAVAITAIATDSGSSSTDFITNDTTLTVSGTNDALVAGEKIQISSDNGTSWADVTQSTTTWSYVDPTTHPASFSYQVRIIDIAGNIGTTASQAVTIDTTAPTEAVAITAIATDSGSSSTDFITNDTTLTVSGTNGALAAGEKIQVSSDNGTTWTDVTQSTTTWSYVDPTTHPTSFSYQVRIIDTAGNVGTTASQAVTIDTTAPTEAIAITAIATDSGTAGDFITNDTTLTVSGTNGALAAGEKIQISSDNGTTWADVTQSTTTWSYVDPTMHPASFSYQVRIIDTAGNIGTTASQAVIIDTTAPAETLAITAIATDSGSSSTDFITNDTTLTVSGTNGALSSGEKIQVSSDNGTIWADVTQSTATSWSYVDPTIHPASFSYQVRIIDTAGNIGTTASQAVTIDTTAPTIAISNSGGPTNQASQTINGAVDVADAGATVTVYDGNTPVKTAIVQNDGSWGAQVTLNSGGNSLTAQVTDLAGNTTTSNAVVYTLSTTGPAVTEHLTADTGSSALDQITSNPALSGTGLANAVVHFTIDGTPTGVTTTADISGNWSFTPTGLNDGQHTIVASQTDTFGNTGSASLTFTLDTTAPAEAVAITAIATDSGTAGDFITNDTTLTVSGTNGVLASGEKIQISSDNGTSWADVTQSTTTWSYVDPTTHPASFSYQVRIIDTAGNVGTTASQAVTIDTTAPTEAVAITAIATDSGTAGDFITNDTTLTVSGTNGVLASGEKIQISSDNGTSWADVTQSTTTWSYVDPTTHPASFSYQVRIIDTAGNIGTTASQAVTIDTTAPAEAVAITAIATDSGTAGDFITNDTTLTVSGTNGALASGEKIQISSDNGTTWADVTQSTTSWSYVDPTTHPASFSYQVRIIDTAGNVGTTAGQTVTIDITTPTIAITSPVAGDNIINKSEAAAGVTISGTATAGSAAVNGQTATITIVDGSNVTKDTYTTTVSNGTWSVNVSAADAQGLADGSYSIKANVSDAAGNAAPTASQAITVDEHAPIIAITSPVAGDNVVNKTEAAAGVTISGTATAGSAAVNGQTATITIVDGSNVIKDSYTTTVSNGTWSVNVSAADAQGLADGSYSIKANVSDAAGNAAPTASQAITVDEHAPTIAITSPVAGDNIINKTEAAAGVTISGTATAGSAAVNGQTATITIVDGSNVTKDSYTPTVSNGTWSVNVSAADAQGLADGSYSIKANVSDAAGNAAPTASQAITVDEHAPTIAITSPVAGDNVVNKTEAAAGVTISGTATAGSAAVNGQTATITIVDGSNVTKDTYTTTVSNGTWSVNVSAADAQGLADGSYSIKANVSDAAGNAAPTASQAIALERVAPTVSISTSGTTTNQPTQTISGTVTAAAGEAAVGSTITLFDTVNGVTTQVGTATVGSGGAWSTSVTLAGNGSNSIVAKDTDVAGNTGTSSAVNFTLATTAPTIAITSPVAGDNIINKSEAAAGVTISGTATAGSAAVNGQTATITIVDASNVTKDSYTTSVSNGTWSVNVSAADAQGLADGSYSIKANVSDAAGNAAPTASQAITVDEHAPTIAITSPVAGDNIINKTEAAAGVTISGTATAGSAAINGQTATITIVDGSNVTKDTYTTTVSNGAWSVNVSAADAQALIDGSYSIKANVSDAAGNAAPTASQAITVDEHAPTIAITSPVAGDNIINKTEAAAGVTISGTATAGSAAVNGQTATITIVDGSNVTKDTYTTTVSNGTWSVNVSAADAQGLADGSYSIKANVSDAAGNAAPTASQTIALERVAPTVSISTSGTTTNQATQTISGTVTAAPNEAAVGSTVTLFDTVNGVTTQVGTATVGSGGAWSTSVTLAGNGSNSIVAKDTDVAGNTGTSSAVNFTLATTAPTIAITSPVAGDNIINKSEAAAGVTISGTATAGSAAVNGQTATITIVDGSNIIKDSYTTTVSNGVWSVNVSAADAQGLADGSYSIKANVSDAAGNAATTASQAIALERVAPTVSISTSGTTTNQATQTISGTVTAAPNEAAVGSTVTLFDTVNGVTTQVGTATVGSGGAWSTSVTLAGNGSNSIVAKDTDVAGNTGTSSAVIFNAVAGRWGNPSGGSWTTAANWSIGTVPGPSTDVVFEPVGAASPYVVTIPASATIAVNTITLDDPNVTLLDQANLTITGALVETVGNFDISNGGSLSVGGGASLLIDFVGSGGSLVLGSSPGFSGTIDAISTATGAVTISGSGNVTTTSGDAVDLQGSSGKLASPASLKVSLTGTITGAANGIVVVQNAVGDVEVDSAASVAGGAGNGILAEIGATGSGNITVNATGSVSGSGAGMNGVLAENLDASNDGNVSVTATGGASGNVFGIEALTYGNGKVSVEAGGTVSSSKQYGIRAQSYGSGNVAVVTDAGSIINSAGSGINAINQDPIIVAGVGTTVSVTANGSINFGSTLNLSGAAPSGIVAGFYGENGTTNTAINGNVLVANFADITQTSGVIGYGIDAYNDGNGNVTVNDGAGTKISTMQNGILASLSGGTGDVAVTVGSSATITAKSGTGIDAHTSSAGKVSVTLAAGDVINSKSDGISAYNQAAAISSAAGSTISISAYGTINSGPTLNGNGTQPAGILATYKGGVNNTPNANVYGSITIDNFANVNAGGGDGIRASDYGIGDVTITDEANTTIIAPRGYGIRENNYGSGSELVTTSANDLIISGSGGINLTHQGTAVPLAANSTVKVFAHGTVFSGTVLNASGTQPQGIVAGYYGANGTTNNSINGSVSIDNYANVVAAAGYAVQAYNWGNGPVTVTEESGTSIIGAQYGIGAYSLGTSGLATATTNNGTPISSVTLSFASVPSSIVAGMTVYDVTTGNSIGTVASTTGSTITLTANASNVVASGDTLSFGDVNINVLSSAKITAGAQSGLAAINANTNNAGNIVVTTAAGDIIESGGRGISLNNGATSAPASSQILTTTYGTINSGFGGGGVTPGGVWAGYNGGTGTFHAGVAGNVTIDNFATINATAGAGIGAYNLGVGNISVTAEATSAITAPYQAVSAFAQGGGNVTVVNQGIISSSTGTGIAVGTGNSLTSAGGGILSITNTGTKDSSGNFTSGIIQALGASINAGAITAVVQINNASTQATTFTNSGLVRSTLYGAGSPLNWAISSYYGGNTANNGAVTINNSGVISGNVSLNVAPSGSTSFQNLAGGVWNILGANFLSGTASITNAGIIDIAGPSQINGSALSIVNNGVVDLAADAVARISVGVSGTGSFDIGAQASLEFGGAVGAGQTVSFGGEQGLLILDAPASFSATIVGAVAGDMIQAGPGYTPPSGFSSLSSNLWLMLPASSPTVLTGSLGAQSLNPAPAQFEFVQLSSATISSSTATGLNIFTGDSNPADTLFVETDQPSSVAVTGAFTAVNLATAGANIAVFNAGAISSTGGTGLSTTSGSGATTIDDFASIGGLTGIRAVAGGTAYTSLATPTTSSTLTFASTPGSIVTGLIVFDETTGQNVGTVQSTTSTTVVLAANAANAVGAGDTLSFGAPTAITNSSTSTQSNILNFASTPSWIVPGTAVYDQTTGKIIGTVSSTSATTAILTANAANLVGNGDTLAFAGPISINVGQAAVIDGPTGTANAATATTSNTLSFASPLSWVAAGMSVYDMTTGQAIGTVASTSGTTVTLSANAASAVGNLDVLSFLTSGSQGIVALTSSGSVGVTTGSFANIIAGGNGINVQNRGKLVAPGALTVDAAGKISSGLVSGGEPAAIQVGYFGGTSTPSSIPSPPLSGIFGDVTIDSAATIAAYSGFGINAFTYGTGNISVSNSGSITATAAGNTNGTVNPTTGFYNPTTAQVGINLVNYGEGDVTLVTTGAITSGSAGIYASNAAFGSQAGPVGTATPVKVAVVANGPINSGSNLTNGGNAPAGIIVNIDPGNIPGYDQYVSGDLFVSASGSSITAQAGDGIRAINHAQGDVRVDIGFNETITALNSAIGATGNVSPIGIALNAFGPGNVTVSTSSGDVINSGGTGINANQQSTVIDASANVIVAVNAAGTIIAGNIQNDGGGTPVGINAGFFNGGAALPNVTGSVIINNSATIIAATRGLSGYNYGNGDVTINNNANVTVSSDNVRANSTTTTTTQVSEYGIQAATWGEGSGDVAVNVYSGAINVTATPTGTASAATSSATLNFVATPGGISAGMIAYDVTTGLVLGTVSSTTATTVTMAASAVAPVANGDMLSFFTAITGATAAATSTSSTTLNFNATPSGVAPGMIVYDLANGTAVGTVSSTSATTVTLTANATVSVANGDSLSFVTSITNQVYGVFAESNDSGNISVITNSGTSIYSSGAGIDATSEASPVALATMTAITSGPTTTASRTLTFATAPAWITLGNPVYDVTTGSVIGTVSSTTAKTVTLTANAANAVGQGDTLSFAQLAVTNASTPTSSNTLTFTSTPAWIVAGMTVYDITTGKTVGTVLSTTGNTVTLAANAATPVGNGDALSFPEIATVTAATSTSSHTLSFAVTPSWIQAGMTAYDDTTGVAIGTVLSTTGTTVVLAANASSAVAAGDMLSFASSSIVVTSNSTITSGNVLTGTGAPPAGIIAAYLGGDAIPAVTPVVGVDGSVTVNNFGDITAVAGDGIRALTYGIGDVTINDGAGTIAALGGATPTNGFGDGIDARAWGPGSILVTTTAGVKINAGSSGISAINYAPSTGNSYAVPSTSQITVIAYGTINSGLIPTLSGDAPAGILAGYNPGVSGSNPVDAVNPLVAGNVLVQDYASITTAAGTDGIRAFNYGTGSVSVIVEAGATIANAQYGVAGFAYGGGNVSITNYASIGGTAAAIDAGAAGAGAILIDNYGTVADAVVSSGAAVTLDNQSGGIWTVTNHSSFASPTTLINNGSFAINGTALMVSGLSGTGTISVSNNGSLEVGTTGGAAAGSITIDSGVTATLAGTYGSTTFVDNGTVVLNGATSFTGVLSGSGQIEIGVGANLTIASVAASAPSIAFQESGTLTLSSADLDGTLTFSPTILGLDGTDKIDFIDPTSSITGAFWNANILTLESGATPVAYLHLSGNYANSTFTVTHANGISQIVDPPSAGHVITDGASLELTAPSSEKVSFAGAGTLALDQPASYEGQIAGFSGADVLTLKGFNAAHTATEAIYNQQNDTTVLTVSDTSDHHAASLILDGNYSSTAFNVTAHKNGGVDITTSPEAVPVGEELELDHASSDTIIFRGGTGTLVLDQPQNFTGKIINFTGTAPDAAHSDIIDVRGINYESIGFNEVYDAPTGVLNLTDGLHSATIKFDDFRGTLNFTSDNRGGTLVADPPATSIPPGDTAARANSDQFVFKTPASGQLASEHFERTQYIDLEHRASDPSDSAGLKMFLFDTTASFAGDAPISSNLDREHLDADLMLLKRAALVSVHSNDFVLPIAG